MTRRPVRRGVRRALTLAALTTLTVPLFASAAFADVGRIGTKYNPDPLSTLDSWLIYGGTIVGGFLLAIILTAISSRKGPRYRAGQQWEHDSVWVGSEPDAPEGAAEAPAEPHATTAPGSGGASGKW